MKQRKIEELQRESCHICGSLAVTRAQIEGAKVPVCAECKDYGQELTVQGQTPRLSQMTGGGKSDVEYVPKAGYGELVRVSRERLKLTREDLAKKLFIHEGELAKIESERLAPGEQVARKLENALKVTLLEKAARGTHAAQPASKRGGGVVLGEIADIK